MKKMNFFIYALLLSLSLGECEESVNGSIPNLLNGSSIFDGLLKGKQLIAYYNKTYKKIKRDNFHIRSKCEHIHRLGSEGIVFNLNYPEDYRTDSTCTWEIYAEPNETITISFDDLDIRNNSASECMNKSESYDSFSGSCCLNDWVRIYSPKTKNERKYCGNINSIRYDLTFFDKTGHTIIELHTSDSSISNSSLGRGFHLSYYTSRSVQNKCNMEEFHCSNRKCIPRKWRCNRRNECGDNSDEVECEDVCARSNEKRCDTGDGNFSPGCYIFPDEHCDDVWHCKNGADEMGCGSCPSNMFLCSESICYSESKRCDGQFDCLDFKDELNCGLCGVNRTLCSPNSLTECYNPFEDRCNRVLDCKNGNDEKSCTINCENKILCSSGSGCYSLLERCNGIPECNDYSDEKNCSMDLCRSSHGSYLCANGRCIRKSWACDRSDDCGDNSEEMNCLRNSVITAALMGSLICGLLLIIAISCTCKLIALRRAERQLADNRQINGNFSQGSQPYPRCFPFISPDNHGAIFGYDRDFMYREPPPSYAASIGLPDQSGNSRQSRRSRRLRRHRRRDLPPDLSENNLSPSYSGQVLPNTAEENINIIVNSVSELQSESASETIRNQEEDKDSDVEGNGNKENPSTIGDESTSQGAPIDTINIELDSIPSFSQIDCDQEQPLLS